MTEAVYAPVNRLKPVCPDVWIVDGPVIRFGMAWPKFPFTTRMTAIRIGQALFVHSPTPLTPELQDEIAALGEVRWIVGPNRIHYWWIPDWHEAYPEAEVWLASGIEDQGRRRLHFEAPRIDREFGFPWDGAIATLPVKGRFMTEVVFFHRASGTLLLTDLIENIEARRLPLWMRPIAWIGGVLAPRGSMPRDMRFTFGGPYRAGLRAAVEKMIEWRPRRILLAHGRCFEEDAVAELGRAFAWVLR